LPRYPYASPPVRSGLDLDCPDLSGVYEYRGDLSGGIGVGLSNPFLGDRYDENATHVELEGPRSGVITVKVFAGSKLLKQVQARSPDDFECADYQVRIGARNSSQSDIAVYRLQDGSVAALYGGTSWAVVGPVIAAHTSGMWVRWTAARRVPE
jgi:hypothetical protein